MTVPFATAPVAWSLDHLRGLLIRDAGEGGAGYAGLVAHLGCDDLGSGGEVGEELLGLLADAAADDDQVGPEEVLDLVQILVEAPGVLLPVQVLALAGSVRGTVRGAPP